MAYYSECELIDVIRHTFISEDDSGICEEVLHAPIKRQVPGGLPLNFMRGEEKDEEEEEDEGRKISSDILANIPTRMRTYTMKQMDLMHKTKKKKEIKSVQWQSPSKIDQNQCPFEEKPVIKREIFMSITSQLVTETAITKFSQFAKFESTTTCRSPSQSFLIFCPQSTTNASIPLTVVVLSSAKVSDLVGLCCLKYTISEREPALKCNNENWKTMLMSVSRFDAFRYQLLMAEETGLIETDLPALTSTDIVGWLDFPALALVQCPTATDCGRKKTQTTINVHLTNGQKYQFELDSLDVSLEWLRDQVLQQRCSQMTESAQSHRRIISEYVLETLQVADVTLSLDTTIQQTGSTEFVLLRQNSSRGDFQPFQLKNIHSNESASSSGTSIIDHFSVQRVHKIKPKCSVRLCAHQWGLFVIVASSRYYVLKHDTIEVVPPFASAERKKSILNTIQMQSYKSTVLEMDKVGGVEMVEERPLGRKLLRIGHRVSRESKDEWKSLFLECECDDSYTIVSRINAILDLRHSVVRRSYLLQASGKSSSFRISRSRRSFFDFH